MTDEGGEQRREHWSDVYGQHVDGGEGRKLPASAVSTRTWWTDDLEIYSCRQTDRHTRYNVRLSWKFLGETSFRYGECKLNRFTVILMYLYTSYCAFVGFLKVRK